MAEGTITDWSPRSKNGHIQPDDGGPELNFQIGDVQGVDRSEANQIQKKMRVSFVVAGKHALSVQLLEPLSTPEPEPESAAPPPRPAPPRFLNPYNFVRVLPDAGTGHLLGRCLPPPHDRYLGLSGEIRCTLKAVTPLFVSDTEKVQPMPPYEEHFNYRFFQYDGKPAIPATTLRGSIRSVFEAATNSCFAVFDGDRRLEYREPPSYGNSLKAGIVRTLPRPAENGQPAQEGEIVLCRVAKVGAYYGGSESWKNVLFRDKPGSGEPWQCGDWAAARVKKGQAGEFVRELAETIADLGDLKDGEEYVEGRLKITGPGIETKRNEFLFLDPDQHGSGRTVRFGMAEMEDYNVVLAGQFEQEGFRSRYQSRRLQKDNLVWVETTPDGRRARRVLGVKVPRVRYGKSLDDLLPPTGQRCDKYEELCPACRLFGWVHAKAPGDATTRVAYAGRVRFSCAEIQGAYKKLKEIPLAILSTPKPTTTRFYLIHKDGRPRGWRNGRFIPRPQDTRAAEAFPGETIAQGEKGRDDIAAGPDGPNVLRGRKFYRHHDRQLRKEEYTRAGDETQQHDKHNRTVRDVLQPGATFTFSVSFENLAPVELGALLWSLEMEGWYHRMGLAKPLGFGSVQITVLDEGTCWFDPAQRYGSLDNAGWQPLTAERRQELVKLFKDAMVACYARDGQGFEDLPNVADPRALLATSSQLPVHYPRPTSMPNPEGKNFEWFMGNKRAGKKEHGPRLELPLAIDEQGDSFDGLPILNAEGNEVIK